MTTGSLSERLQLFEGTALTRQDGIARFEAWQDGHDVQSRGIAIGSITISEEEQIAVRSLSLNYANISTEAIHGRPTKGIAVENRRILTPRQRSAIKSLHAVFLSAVRLDAERSGLGLTDPQSVLIQAGYYEPDAQALDWHTDAYDYPAARYVAAFGQAGATNFALGAINKADLDSHGQLSPHISVGKDGRLVTNDYGTTTLSRFLTNVDLHRSPTTEGARLFFSASVPL